MKFLQKIPCSYHWIIKKNLKKDIKTILDLGCGEGNFMSDLAFGENWSITGVELYPPSVVKAKKTGIYKKVIQADVLKYTHTASEKFDLVFCSQVIEHIKKSDGEKLLAKLEKIAQKQIVICTPVGFIKFDRVEVAVEDDNPLEEHQSGWQPEEFLARGYKVYGQGARIIYGENGLIRKSPKIVWPFLILISYLLALLVLTNPSKATYMIAVKNI